MDNTTLHTFLFHCPVALRSLVLLGSWDNFSKSYPLELDQRRGRNYWRGCFTFSDIICDGDLEEHPQKRDGPLKMGGTYWYYYKVDADDECHNPSEPSTTFCPLLPGQRLNVLEVPSEGHSWTNSAPSDGFTRNPDDRYLNPVPPVPPPKLSPHLGPPSPNLYSLPLPSPWAPMSATYPPSDGFLCPDVARHARSASASPHIPSAPLFPDFKCFKDKLASKRAASRPPSSSKPRELDISQPVLTSAISEHLNLIPLGSFGPAPTSAPREAPPTASTITRPPPTMRNGFSPLGSNPVDPVNHVLFTQTSPLAEGRPDSRRCRSHGASTIITSEFKLDRGRTRANSADTRRTQHYHFSNDPWLSTPKTQQAFDMHVQEHSVHLVPAPTLQRPCTLAPPASVERPSSSHGSSKSPSLRLSPCDKDLPELPRYLTPAPLFACNHLAPVETLAEDKPSAEEPVRDEDHEVLGDVILEYEEKPQSHFSLWSRESTAYTSSTSEESGINSPTFSSLTSDASDMGSPQRFSLRYSYAEPRSGDSEDEAPAPSDETNIDHLSMTPPRLEHFRISAFGPDLFNLEIKHADAAPRRQAACFGLGFQYSLPEDDSGSKTTITAPELGPPPSMQRGSSVSQLNKLMDEFGYLGDAVI
ncbi:hypothetical protein ACEQ8H_006398 [Pleosporales sp. CAS-2024a]